MYTVDLSTNGTEVYNDTVDEHYYLFDELEPLTEYRITIGAINSIGVGWTEIINVYTLGKYSEFARVSSNIVII